MKKRINMKSKFVGMPKSCYDVLTFGELSKLDKFIGLPVPGDNCGHGGLRGSSNVFKKIAPRATDRPALFPENAFRLRDGNLSNFPKDMPKSTHFL